MARTVFKGRPNLKAIVYDLSAQKEISVGMVVCGPSSMVHDIGEAATAAQQRLLGGENLAAKQVGLHCETFL